ncbi:hypothetical protein NIES4103_09150 [Nostoc sp. NIES-4103]|nr:hypothetical protein NIES4103_09150 [Nostoc sp. NIES-4103]
MPVDGLSEYEPPLRTIEPERPYPTVLVAEVIQQQANLSNVIEN